MMMFMGMMMHKLQLEFVENIPKKKTLDAGFAWQVGAEGCVGIYRKSYVLIGI